jgi:hypothetical protein
MDDMWPTCVLGMTVEDHRAPEQHMVRTYLRHTIMLRGSRCEWHPPSSGTELLPPWSTTLPPCSMCSEDELMPCQSSTMDLPLLRETRRGLGCGLCMSDESEAGLGGQVVAC